MSKSRGVYPVLTAGGSVGPAEGKFVHICLDRPLQTGAGKTVLHSEGVVMC